MISDEQAGDKAWCLSKDGAAALLNYIEGAAESMFCKDGHLCVVALLWSYRDGQMEMDVLPAHAVPGCDGNSDSKAFFEHAVRTLAFQIDAFALAVVAEASAVLTPEGATIAEGKAMLLRPELRSEIVVIAFEHPAIPHASCSSTSAVTRQIPGDTESPGTLGPWNRTGDDAPIYGSFTALLPGARGN